MVSKGVDGVRYGKPLGAPQAHGGGAGCWVIAGTWPRPGGARDFHLPTVLARGFIPLELAAREFSLLAVPARDFLFPTVSSCGFFSEGGAASVFSMPAVFARYFFLPTVIVPGLFLLA